MERTHRLLVSSQIARFASLIYVIKELLEHTNEDVILGMYPHIIDTLMVAHYGLDGLSSKLIGEE